MCSLLASLILVILARFTLHADATQPGYSCFNRTADVGVDGSHVAIAELYSVVATECMDWCLRESVPMTNQLCQSFVFHKWHYSCSMYGVGGEARMSTATAASQDRLPTMVVPAMGNDWYNRVRYGGELGHCGSQTIVTTAAPTTVTTTTTTIATTTARPKYVCASGSRVAYVLFIGERATNDGVLDTRTEQEACADACTRNSIDLGGDPLDLNCYSVNFVPQGGLERCVVLDDFAAPRGGGGVIADPSSIYAEKLCVPSSVRCGSTGEQQELYVGSHDLRPSDESLIDVLATDTVELCNAQCHDTDGCAGITFDFDTSAANCNLFGSNALTAGLGSGSVFIENACFAGPSKHSCASDQRTHYMVKVDGGVRFDGGVDVVTIDGVDEAECQDLCTNNVDRDGNGIRCASANYRPVQQGVDSAVCQLYSDQLEPAGPGILQPNLQQIYAEKFCLPASVTNCALFIIYKDIVPVSAPISSSPSASSHDCSRSCASTTDCVTSAFDGASCRLFRTRIEEGDTVGVVELGVHTVENGCNAAARIIPRDLRGAVLMQRLKRVAAVRAVGRSSTAVNSTVELASGSWSKWSPCQFSVKGDAVRVRTMDNCDLGECRKGQIQLERC